MFLSFAIFFINIGGFLPVENKHKRFHYVVFFNAVNLLFKIDTPAAGANANT